MQRKLIIKRTTKGIEYYTINGVCKNYLYCEKANPLAITLFMQSMIDVFRTCGYKIVMKG